MDNRKDRLHELKIACAILDTTVAELARDWDCSDMSIRYAAQIPTTSKRIRGMVDDKIEEAQEIVPFSYATNGQTNGQKNNTEKPQKLSA